MAWSKSTRISIMLAIDIAFFLVELISGFMVHSLALMADAFHMLNDIISLIIGLWAVNVAKQETTDKYSYGFVRAEILGAFFNAVFLIALCVSIILEALTRFIEPQEVTNPKLILVVGCCGLASNLVGFIVLGGHGHSHGPGEEDHDHDHEHGDEHVHDHPRQQDTIAAAEEGRARGLNAIVDENGPAMDALPQVALARAQVASASSETLRRIQFNEPERGQSTTRSSTSRGEGRRSNSVKHSRLTSIDDLSIHPAIQRQEIIDRTRDDASDESSEADAEGSAVDERAPLIGRGGHVGGHGTMSHSSHGHDSHSRRSSRRPRRDSGVHREHNHNNPASGSRKSGGHGHSHGDMGMNAMVLHVLGDALGNVGVIATALIIWLTTWPGRQYADPAVSLFITLIILKSAIPLTRATSKVLLQATPDHLELSEVKEDIQNLPGVISCHHVHIWQLSDTKLVASLHIQVAFPITEEGGEKYMKLAKQARKCLHAYGIHSATIQPEFCLDEGCHHSEDGSLTLDGHSTPRCGTKNEGDVACLLDHDHDHGHAH
ncbi:Zinc resistance conferring protein [Diatrype stigma]|uniref:Zinc resistance conferring protein n=1 Tax=Diatrype stigma TaxID=117547 RepID=A0AAN9YN15_9PEZI